VIRNFPWFGVTITVIIVGFLTLLGWTTYAHIDGYRSQCHNAGGHIIEVRDEEICVDRENRVIFL
jgi:hypothetical protein